MPDQQPNLEEQVNQATQPIEPPQKPKFNLKYILIVVILAAIVGGGILTYQYWWLPRHSEKPEEVKDINYLNILDYTNISFQYPSNLHLIQNRQELSDTNVCTDIPPGPEYAYYDLCQHHTFEPSLSLISSDSKSAIEISDLDSNSSIDNLKTLWNKFIQQYFSEYSFDKQDSMPLDPNKLPLDGSEGRESFASVYGSSNPDAPLVVFFPAFGLGRSPNGWALILKDKKFQQAFDTIIKSFNLNNTAQLVKTDLTNGSSSPIDSPLYVADLKFHDFYNQKFLLSDGEKLVVFDLEGGKFIELFKWKEISNWLEIPSEHLWMVYYSGSFMFNRPDPSVIYCLVGLGGNENFIFRYNIQTKEKEIIYQAELPLLPSRLYPPIGKDLIIMSAYGDAGCFSSNYTILNVENKKIKEGWSEGWCVEENGENSVGEKSIGVSSDGTYIFISSKRNNQSELYLYNNLNGRKSLLWSGEIPKIEGEMIGTYRFRFYDEDGNPKLYNLQSQEFESFGELTTRIIGVRYNPIEYNENGFVYEERKSLSYLNYISNRLVPLYGIDVRRLLFLTNSHAISWK